MTRAHTPSPSPGRESKWPSQHASQSRIGSSVRNGSSSITIPLRGQLLRNRDGQPCVQPDRVRRRPSAPPARPVNLVSLGGTRSFAMSMRAITSVVAGLVAALLWTVLESSLISLFPVASSRLMWRATQFFVGLMSAVILVLPIVFVLRPVSYRHGLLFVAGFLASEIPLHLTFGGTTTSLVEMFQLPDTWAFLGTSVCLFWLASSFKVGPHAA